MVIAHLNVGARFSSEISDLYLHFIKFIAGKAGSHTHVLQHTRQLSRDCTEICPFWKLVALKLHLFLSLPLFSTNSTYISIHSIAAE